MSDTDNIDEPTTFSVDGPPGQVDVTDTEPTVPVPPTAEDVAKWTAAIREIMERDGVTEEQANAGLVWAVVDAEIRAEIAELAEHEADVALWTSVIRDLQVRFPEWTEQECNDNLIALLIWVREHPADEG